jgi:hypothetical protein
LATIRWQEIIAVQSIPAIGTHRLEAPTEIIEGAILTSSKAITFQVRFASSRGAKRSLPGLGGTARFCGRPSRLQIAEKTIQHPKFTTRGRHIVDNMSAQYYDVSSESLPRTSMVARHFGLPGGSVFARSETIARISAIRANPNPCSAACPGDPQGGHLEPEHTQAQIFLQLCG